MSSEPKRVTIVSEIARVWRLVPTEQPCGLAARMTRTNAMSFAAGVRPSQGSVSAERVAALCLAGRIPVPTCGESKATTLNMPKRGSPLSTAPVSG